MFFGILKSGAPWYSSKKGYWHRTNLPPRSTFLRNSKIKTVTGWVLPHGLGYYNVLIVNGNAVARDVVVHAEVPLAFTDTDDVNVAIVAGHPVKMIFPDSDGLGTLLIPNTIALIKGAPHPRAGKKLIDFLLSKEVESQLAFSDSMQIPVRADVKKPPHVPDYSAIRAMQLDYQDIADNMERAARFSRELFIR